MVDSHEVLIDNNYNGNSALKNDNAPNLCANLMPMNELVSQQGIEENGSNISKSVKIDCDKNEENTYEHLDDPGEILCGSLSIQKYANIKILSINKTSNCTNNIQPHLVTLNGDTSLSPIKDIEFISKSPKEECSLVNNQMQASKSNDSCQQWKKTITSISINSADHHTANEYSAEISSKAIISVKNQTITNKMDSRKVEPIRININRDPIKTKIKLGPSSHDCQTMSPKSSSSSSNNDECDNVTETTHENTQIYPKITIRPIIKPQMNHHHNHGNAGLQTSSLSSTSHETIPKLKIKKVDSNSLTHNQMSKPTLTTTLNSDEINSNYQTHILSESTTSVPT